MITTTLKIAKHAQTRRQSGVIPYRFMRNALEVMLITNRSGKRLLVPKGCLERDLSPIESAQKEAFEEAGVVGKAHRRPIGSMLGMRNGRECVIDLWPMRVTTVYATWPEMALRQRMWLPAESAALLVEREDLAELILQLGDWLQQSRVAA